MLKPQGCALWLSGPLCTSPWGLGAIQHAAYHKNLLGFAILSLAFSVKSFRTGGDAREAHCIRGTSMFRDYKRLNRVEERLDLVEREFKALELEWSTVYDKVRTTLAKL